MRYAGLAPSRVGYATSTYFMDQASLRKGVLKGGRRDSLAPVEGEVLSLEKECEYNED